MTEFTITIGNQPAKVEQQDNQNFVVHPAEKPLQLYVKQDNEGANHWFDAATNSETPQTIEAGKAIEAYGANKNI